MNDYKKLVNWNKLYFMQANGSEIYRSGNPKILDLYWDEAVLG
jgi:hypothetical protein